MIVKMCQGLNLGLEWVDMVTPMHSPLVKCRTVQRAQLTLNGEFFCELLNGFQISSRHSLQQLVGGTVKAENEGPE